MDATPDLVFEDITHQNPKLLHLEILDHGFNFEFQVENYENQLLTIYASSGDIITQISPTVYKAAAPKIAASSRTNPFTPMTTMPAYRSGVVITYRKTLGDRTSRDPVYQKIFRLKIDRRQFEQDGVVYISEFGWYLAYGTTDRRPVPPHEQFAALFEKSFLDSDFEDRFPHGQGPLPFILYHNISGDSVESYLATCNGRDIFTLPAVQCPAMRKDYFAIKVIFADASGQERTPIQKLIYGPISSILNDDEHVGYFTLDPLTPQQDAQKERISMCFAFSMVALQSFIKSNYTRFHPDYHLDTGLFNKSYELNPGQLITQFEHKDILEFEKSKLRREHQHEIDQLNASIRRLEGELSHAQDTITTLINQKQDLDHSLDLCRKANKRLEYENAYHVDPRTKSERAEEDRRERRAKERHERHKDRTESIKTISAIVAVVVSVATLLKGPLIKLGKLILIAIRNAPAPTNP